jgi:translation initiation factor IF-2
MEDVKSKESIKHQLGGDGVKKKIIIKKKSSTPETTSGSSATPGKKLDDLIKQEMAATKQSSKSEGENTQAESQSKDQSVSRPHSEKKSDAVVQPLKIPEPREKPIIIQQSIHRAPPQQKEGFNKSQSNTYQNRTPYPQGQNQNRDTKPKEHTPQSHPNPENQNRNTIVSRNQDRNPIVSRPAPRPPQNTSGSTSRPNDRRGPNTSPGAGGPNRRPGGPGGGGYQGNRTGPGGGGGGYQGRQGSGGGNTGGYRPPRPGGSSGSGTGGAGQSIDLPKESVAGAVRKRSVFSDKGKSKEIEKGKENTKFFKQMVMKKQQIPVSGTTVPKEISIMENIQVGELAKKLNLKPNDVIAKLMKMGVMVTINNIIDSDTAILLSDEYGCKVKIVSLYEETVIQEEDDNTEDYGNRPPVVTIMGHVDHGKTRLLDTIRQSAIIDTESGGITQHIGAYQVKIPRGTITFLDTPGHEAFTAMRARGASVTDIVVLVVAADDGVKPQTIEAINHAKAAEVPIIVAINKIDLPSANLDRVMQDLSNLELLPEEWGGKTITCKISAKEKIGIDNLLDMILVQAEVLELKANNKRSAKGTIIEAKLDPGRGPVATVLIQNGTLKVGDAFLSGIHAGKVRAMYDDHGKNILIAPPSCPVLVTGLDAVPEAGDPFDAIKDEKEARNISSHRKEYQRIGQAANTVRVTLDNMNEIIQQGGLKELKIIIKSDVRGSAEAIKEALEKLSTSDVKLTVIHAGTGQIVDADIMLASASNAIVVGFHVRANPRTLTLAEKEQVQIKYYSIIYDVVNDIKASMEGMLEPEKVESIVAKLEIREVFKISKMGNIAGCMVLSGKINKNNNIRVIRDNIVIFDGRMKSLKRIKDDVTEVATGFECGVFLDGFNDFNIKDELEVYEVKEVARKL